MICERLAITSVEVIRLSYKRNTNRPWALIADMTGTDPLLPVTFCFGV